MPQYSGVHLLLVVLLRLAVQQRLERALPLAAHWDRLVVKCLGREQLHPAWEALGKKWSYHLHVTKHFKYFMVAIDTQLYYQMPFEICIG